MPTLVVEINDAGILTKGEPAGPANGLARPSPGFARIDGASLLTGEEALAGARLQPRHVNSRFWCDLDRSPMPRPFPDHITRADLAHAHLSSIWERVGGGIDRVILALPGSNSEAQLALILGVARACGMPVVGMVDSALAAAARRFEGRRMIHLDLQLHRTVVTEMSCDGMLSRRRVEVSDHAGIASFHDVWAKHIAGAFVKSTRFDPLHVATTEQALYDRIPALLETLCRAKLTTAEVESGGKVHAVELSRDRLVDAVEGLYEGIAQIVRSVKRAGESAGLLLSCRASALPGLESRLAEIGETEIVALSADAPSDGALGMQDAICSEGEALPFVVRLPSVGQEFPDAPTASLRPPSPVSEPRSAPKRSGRRPTHVLHEGLAYGIDTVPLVVGTAVADGERGVTVQGSTAGVSRRHCSVSERHGRFLVEDHSTYGTFLNGQKVDGTAELLAGDVLRVGSPGVELRLIAVVQSDGAANR